MTQYAPGWYPDGSGRFTERYFDGEHWTADVRDHLGRAVSDPVPGVTVDRSASTTDVVATTTSPPPPSPASRWSNAASTDAASSPPASWSAGTSASSFQFGPAPTYATAYAEDATTEPPHPDRSSGVPVAAALRRHRLMWAAGAGAVAVLVLALALSLLG